MKGSLITKLSVTILAVIMLIGVSSVYADDEKKESVEPVIEELMSESESYIETLLTNLRECHASFLKEIDNQINQIVKDIEELNQKLANEEKHDSNDESKLTSLQNAKEKYEKLKETENQIYSDLEETLSGKKEQMRMTDREETYKKKIEDVNSAIELLASQKDNTDNKDAVEKRISQLEVIKSNLEYEQDYANTLGTWGDGYSQIGLGFIYNSCPEKAILTDINIEYSFDYTPNTYKLFADNGYSEVYLFDCEYRIKGIEICDSTEILEDFYGDSYLCNDSKEAENQEEIIEEIIPNEAEKYDLPHNHTIFYFDSDENSNGAYYYYDDESQFYYDDSFNYGDIPQNNYDYQYNHGDSSQYDHYYSYDNSGDCRYGYDYQYNYDEKPQHNHDNSCCIDERQQNVCDDPCCYDDYSCYSNDMYSYDEVETIDDYWMNAVNSVYDYYNALLNQCNERVAAINVQINNLLAEKSLIESELKTNTDNESKNTELQFKLNVVEKKLEILNSSINKLESDAEKYAEQLNSVLNTLLLKEETTDEVIPENDIDKKNDENDLSSYNSLNADQNDDINDKSNTEVITDSDINQEVNEDIENVAGQQDTVNIPSNELPVENLTEENSASEIEAKPIDESKNSNNFEDVESDKKENIITLKSRYENYVQKIEDVDSAIKELTSQKDKIQSSAENTSDDETAEIRKIEKRISQLNQLKKLLVQEKGILCPTYVEIEKLTSTIKDLEESNLDLDDNSEEKQSNKLLIEQSQAKIENIKNSCKDDDKKTVDMGKVFLRSGIIDNWVDLQFNMDALLNSCY